MKYILAEKDLEIPEGIEIEVKSRVVEIKGPLGKLRRSFKHVPFDMRKIKDDKTKKSRLVFQMWNQKRKQIAILGSVRGTISNMIRGVTNGYKFKMVLAYAHFPIIANVLDGGKVFHQ
jgi:large subunit ribosomal protein L9e